MVKIYLLSLYGNPISTSKIYARQYKEEIFPCASMEVVKGLADVVDIQETNCKFYSNFKKYQFQEEKGFFSFINKKNHQLLSKSVTCRSEIVHHVSFPLKYLYMAYFTCL